MQPQITAGDTLNFEVPVSGYASADGWALKFRLVPRASGGAPIEFTTIAGTDGAAHLVQVGASTTAAWAPGVYSWTSWVERPGERYSVSRGQVSVLPDPASQTGGYDARSQAEIALEAVNAVLQGRATDAVARYRINGREVERYSIPDLQRLRSLLEADVARERRAAGLADRTGTVQRILVRMR